MPSIDEVVPPSTIRNFMLNSVVPLISLKNGALLMPKLVGKTTGYSFLIS